MNTKNYIALVEKDFTLNKEVESYFKKKNIEIVDYFKNLNILQLKSAYPLEAQKLEHIKYLELDKSFFIKK